MASQGVDFDFTSRGADKLASDFRKTGDNAAIASKGARLLADALGKQRKAADVSAGASIALARADSILEEAEHGLRDGALEAEFALKKQAEAEKKAAVAAVAAAEAEKKAARDRKQALSGLKLSPGLVGPALALAPAITTLGGVVAGIGVGLAGAFTAGAGALAAFGAVAKPVLTDAKTAAGAVEKAQTAHAAAVAKVTGQYQYAMSVAKTKAQRDAAYAAEQKGFSAAGLAQAAAQSKAYAGMSAAQIALSRQIGAMGDAWDKVKAAETPVVAGALQPWLRSVTDLTKNLPPVIAKIAPVIQGLGTQFDNLVNSSAFRGFRDFIGSTGSAAVSAGGSTIIGLVKSFMLLLPQFDPLIREAVGWISRLGPAVLAWSSSKKASDDITRFMQWFSQNGHVVGDLLKNIGGALKALAPGLAAGGALELKVISDFLGLVAKLPKDVAKPLAEVAGAALILSKMGVLKVGLQVVGPAVKWLTGGLISIGSGATAGAEIQAAMATGGRLAGAEIAAAMRGGGAAGGIAGGGAAGTAAGKAAGGGFLAGLSAAVGPAIGGVLTGLLIRGIGDTLSPAGSFAGKLNANLQSLAGTAGGLFSTSLLHSFTFGGLEAWMAVHFGQPVGGALNNVASGAKIWGKGLVTSIGGFFSTIAHGAGIAFGNVGQSAQSGLSAAGRHADTLRTRSLVPLQGEIGKVSGGIQGLSGIIQTTMLNALRQAGAKSDTLRTANLLPLRGEVGRVSGGIQGLQGSINALHGKTVNVGVHGSGSGGVQITPSSGVPGAKNYSVFFKPAALGGMINGGRPGRDSVPAMLMPGEVVVPANMVQAGAVDHLRGRLPGFASGGLISGGSLAGAQDAVARFGGADAAAEAQVDVSALIKAIKASIAARAAQLNPFAGITGVPSTGPIGAGAAAAQAYAKSILWAYGWGMNQFPPLQALWNRESGWNYRAYNAASGATGIPQSLPASKMASAGADYLTNPATQIRWGLGYIKAVYGSPANAYGRWLGRSPHWYGEGGIVPGFASGGVAGQGAAYLKAWQTRHGGPYGLAAGPKVLNEQIAEMRAALGRAKTLAGAGGLSPGQHKFWANAAAADTRLLATYGKELTTERAWRTGLELNELSLDRQIRAAGNIPSLAGPARGWKAQLGRDKAKVTAISKMLGYPDAFLAAHKPAGKPAGKPPAVTPPSPFASVSSVDTASMISQLFAALTSGSRIVTMDSGGWLMPGQLAYNGTRRPEQVLPPGSGAGRGGGGTYVFNFPHYVGSHSDLVRALDDLRRQGRLPR